MTSHITASIFIGIGATLFIDAWNTLLKRALGIPSLNYCFLGRWTAHLADGVFSHQSIAAAPARRFECTLGWLSHYAIGVGLACAFTLGIGADWLARPTLLPALLFGIATVAFPFFVLQPALGLGIASAATRHPLRARMKSLATHTSYGIGLYVFANITAWFLTR